MRRLIDNQEIRIDNHHRGDGTMMDWDDTSKEVHIDKYSKYDGKSRSYKYRYRFEIPINVSSDITFESTNVPPKIRKEILDAFSNIDKRSKFIKELIETLKNYDSKLSDAQRAIAAIRRISKFFDLKWNDNEIRKNIDIACKKYNVVFSEKEEKYFVELNPKEIIIGKKYD